MARGLSFFLLFVISNSVLAFVFRSCFIPFGDSEGEIDD